MSHNRIETRLWDPPAPSDDFAVLSDSERITRQQTITIGETPWRVFKTFSTAEKSLIHPQKLLRSRERRTVYTERLAAQMLAFLVRNRLRHHTGTTALRFMRDVVLFDRFLSHQGYEAASIGPADLTRNLVMPWTARIRRKRHIDRGSGLLRTFIPWAAAQGGAGYSLLEVERIRALELHIGTPGRIAQGGGPNEGAFQYEEKIQILESLIHPCPDHEPWVRLLIWILLDTGARHASVINLRWDGLDVSPLGDRFHLNLPRVKGARPRLDQTYRRVISTELGKLLERHRQGADSPWIFPDLRKSRYVSMEIGREMDIWARIHGLRTVAGVPNADPVLLRVRSNRFRHTLARDMADQGASARQIAAALDDKSLTMALIYCDNTSIMVDILEGTLDIHPLWQEIVALYQGERLDDGDGDLPEILGSAYHLAGFLEYAEKIGSIGRCAMKGECTKAPPLSCYECEDFRYHPDPGRHANQLQQCVDEIRANRGKESDRMAHVLLPSMKAIKALITDLRGGEREADRIGARLVGEQV